MISSLLRVKVGLAFGASSAQGALQAFLSVGPLELFKVVLCPFDIDTILVHLDLCVGLAIGGLDLVAVVARVATRCLTRGAYRLLLVSSGSGMLDVWTDASNGGRLWTCRCIVRHAGMQRELRVQRQAWLLLFFLREIKRNSPDLLPPNQLALGIFGPRVRSMNKMHAAAGC